MKGISSHNICSGIKSQHVKQTICHSVPKTFDFSQNSSVPFHRATFDLSISCVLLIDKPNESCQNSKKNWNRCHKLFKRKWNSITSAKTNAPIPQTSSERLKLTIRTYQMRNKELKNEAWATSRGNIKSIFYINDSGNWPKKKLPFMRLILEEQQKYLQSFINNATYHCIDSDADVTYQTFNLFSLTNFLSTLFLLFHVTFDEISTTLSYNSGEGRCAQYMCSNDIFVLWSRIYAIFHEDRK